MDICRICSLIVTFIELVAQKLTQNTKEQNFLGVGKVGINCYLCTTENLNNERTSKLAAYSTINLCFCVVLVWSNWQRREMEGKGLKMDRLENYLFHSVKHTLRYSGKPKCKIHCVHCLVVYNRAPVLKKLGNAARKSKKKVEWSTKIGELGSCGTL